MHARLYKADAAGTFRCNVGGDGYRVVPAAAARAAGEYSVSARPGRLPVRVRANGGEWQHYGNCDARFCGPFDFLDIDSAEAGDVYAVEVYRRDEAVVPAGRPARTGVLLAAAGTSLPAADPALATDGWPMRPGLLGVTTYLAGALCVATLWVRRLDGTWFNTGEQLDPAGTGINYDSRGIRVPADRFYWRAAAAGLTATIEAQWEVG